MRKVENAVAAGVVAAALALVAGAVHGGEAVVYKGSGNYVADDRLMPLTSGDAVMLGTTQGAIAISTSPPSIMDVKCSGMGIVKSAGGFGSVFYCALTDSLNAADGFDLKGIETEEGTRVEIVGGAGKWAGATGTGTVQSTMSHENGGSIEFEFENTLPD